MTQDPGFSIEWKMHLKLQYLEALGGLTTPRHWGSNSDACPPAPNRLSDPLEMDLICDGDSQTAPPLEASKRVHLVDLNQLWRPCIG